MALKETFPIPAIVPMLIGTAVAVEKGVKTGIVSTAEAGFGAFLVSDGFDDMDRSLRFALEDNKLFSIANGVAGMGKTALGFLLIETSLNPLFYNPESAGTIDALAAVAGAGLAVSFLAVKTIREFRGRQRLNPNPYKY